jgi:uncharacterized membrane protein YidH (DUF202 family)
VTMSGKDGRPIDRPSNDAGLQPERTSLAWGRTMLALVTVSTIFLRWAEHHGLFVLSLWGVSCVTAAAIFLTQRERYARGREGISRGTIGPNAASVLWTASSGLALGVLGIYAVLAL